MAPVERLRRHLEPIVDLNAAQALLGWDQETYMPPAGVESRAAQLATLGRMAHELLTDRQTERLLSAAEDELDGYEPDSDEARLVRIARRDFDKATRIPANLVSELARTTALGQQAWRDARQRGDFAHFRPHLERILDLTLQKAEAIGYDATPYDALLDEYEPEMTTARVVALFAELRQQLVPIVREIGAAEAPDDSMLRRRYPEARQWEFGLGVIRDFGFDFERGRQDRSAHPFSTNLSIDDVRITTRVDELFLPTSLFGSLHEAGHALYEQGVARSLERTLLANGTSLGVHESQSRLWENLVGRSRPFWEHYYPRLRSMFPEQLVATSLDEFYGAINRVQPSLIRVEADEVTYNLHIMIRLELEVELVEGRLSVADLPDAWNASYEQTLGLAPAGDADGVLQDIHWSLGAIGYFSTYALGNLISTQLFDAARADIGDLDAQIGRGELGELLAWLRDRVHRHGRKLTAAELLQRATGNDLGSESWLAYVRGKFGALYGL